MPVILLSLSYREGRKGPIYYYLTNLSWGVTSIPSSTVSLGHQCNTYGRQSNLHVSRHAHTHRQTCLWLCSWHSLVPRPHSQVFDVGMTGERGYSTESNRWVHTWCTYICASVMETQGLFIRDSWVSNLSEDKLATCRGGGGDVSTILVLLPAGHSIKQIPESSPLLHSLPRTGSPLIKVWSHQFCDTQYSHV